MIINQDSKRMAELLRNGYAMLNLSCPICNNPIFKNKKQELFCPICNRKVILVNQKSIRDRENLSVNNIEEESVNVNSKSLVNFNFGPLTDAINKKVNWLVELVKNETQFDQLEKEITLIKELIVILEKIKNFITKN